MNPAPPVMRTVRFSAAAPRPRMHRGCARGETVRHPAHVLDERRRIDPIAMVGDLHQHRVDQLLVQQPRLKPEVEQLGVLGVVVVLFHFLARVRPVLDGDVPAEVLAGLLHPLGQLEHAELLGELVVDAQLAGVGRVGGGQRDALDRVADVEVAACLAALAVDRQRIADDGLDAEPVEGGPEDLVVVEAGRKPGVERRLVGLEAVDDALVEVGRPEAPDPRREVDVVRVVDLGEVVHRTGRLGVEERVLTGPCGRRSGSPPRCRCRASRTRPSSRA